MDDERNQILSGITIDLFKGHFFIKTFTEVLTIVYTMTSVTAQVLQETHLNTNLRKSRLQWYHLVLRWINQ
jgi:hypothetical protein